MQLPKISLYVAIDEKRGIGRDNKVPWRLREDLVRLKNKTIGHVVIVGRTTYESMLGYYAKSGKPTMSMRTHIVVTRDPSYAVDADKGFAVTSIDEAIAKAKEIEKEEIFILGGAKIFEQTMHIADRIYLTIVHHDFDADTFFPEYESEFSKVVEKEERSDWDYPYTFITLEK